MGQLTIYLDDDLARRVKDQAARVGCSVSAYIAQTLRSKVHPSWPPEFVALSGAWADDDGIEVPDRKNEVPDLPRESF